VGGGGGGVGGVRYFLATSITPPPPPPGYMYLVSIPNRDQGESTVGGGWAYSTNIYLEYHSLCSIVGIGTPHPLSLKGACPPPPVPRGGTAGEGGGRVPIPTTGEKT
jgi:hypothetical protein